MLKKIQSFFEKNFQLSESSQDSIEHQLNLAAAALLIEMSFQDNTVNEVEIEAAKQSMISHLGLSADETHALYELAEEEKHQATDYHQFTQLISQHYTQPQKIILIESLWAVAYSDSQLDKYEEQMVRKVCDLIHVSHKDFLQAKHRVEAKLND